MDEEIDGALAGMNLATKRTKEFIQKHGGARWCCFIMALSGLLAFLTMLVLFT